MLKTFVRKLREGGVEMSDITKRHTHTSAGEETLY